MWRLSVMFWRDGVMLFLFWRWGLRFGVGFSGIVSLYLFDLWGFRGIILVVGLCSLGALVHRGMARVYALYQKS